MTRTRNKSCSNCGIIPAEKYMRKLADQNLYCNDCREALVNCSKKELKNLGHPYYLNFKKLKNENGRLKNNQRRNETQQLATIQKERDGLVAQLTDLQIALNKANKEIQDEREIHEDSLKIQDNWYHRLPPNDTNLKNILTDFAQKYLKLNWKNKVKKQRIKELENYLEIVNHLANFQLQELQQTNKLLQEQLTKIKQENITLKLDLEFVVKEKDEIKEDCRKVIQNHQQEFQLQELQQTSKLLQKQLTKLQQENISLKLDLEFVAKEKDEIKEDCQKVIQNHQEEILQLQQQIQQEELLPRTMTKLTFWKKC
ncbi:hypothetical protein C1645_803284 [Glomus cerebriforme]|uniref:Uncharacterized protein n=1 Tax=Glomus cerebriforme TaxID=658196 RepID=A0A397TAR1_9GLOM|nr:hypothetical protein C1645_803284 [Glomus cerebriforme]